jgi:hypothetical protein
MLNLTTYEPLSALELVQPSRRRNPALALALSMFFPGLGHLYIGLRRNAALIMGFEALALLMVGFGTGMLHAQAILMVPALYCFAMADAYFGAREWNAGATSLLIGANPRVAAILNLLTKGFGYFYLGDRTKGIICFLIVTAAQTLLLAKENVWTSTLGITLQIGIAVDGYRIGRGRLISAHPELGAATNDLETLSVVDQANPHGLRPTFAIVLFIFFGALATIGYGTLRALNGHTVNSRGTLEQGPSGLKYSNAKEHLEITVPEDWVPVRTEGLLTKFTSTGCSFVVEEQFAMFALESSIAANKNQILKLYPAASITSRQMTIAGRSTQGFDADFETSSGIVVHQRVLELRRGFKVLIFLETWTKPQHRPVFNRIEQSISF